MNELSTEGKEALIRALSYYYENVIWNTMAKKDNSLASDEDYRIREVMNKLGIRSMLPNRIAERL